MREAYKNTNYKAKREVITTLFSTLKTPSRKNASKAFTTCLKIEKRTKHAHPYNNYQSIRRK